MALCFYDYRYVVCLFGASSFLPGRSTRLGSRLSGLFGSYTFKQIIGGTTTSPSAGPARGAGTEPSAALRGSGFSEPVLAAARTRHGHQNLHHGLIVAGKAKGRIAFEGKPCLVGVCSSIAEVKEGVAWAHSVSRSKLIIAGRRSRGGALDRINAKLHQPQRANCPHALCPRG